jgi:ABC-type dipeptide/oligopeptide/nickel transport system ATPase component
MEPMKSGSASAEQAYEMDVGENLLEIQDLHTYFFTPEGLVKALDGVDLSLRTGHTLGIVGESGCGKTVLALSILQLIPQPP